MYFASGTWSLIRKREIRYPTRFFNSLIFSQDNDFSMKAHMFFFLCPPSCLSGGTCGDTSGTVGHLFSDSCPKRDLLWEPGKVSQLLHSWAARSY